jgi:hypothetical protein
MPADDEIKATIKSAVEQTYKILNNIVCPGSCDKSCVYWETKTDDDYNCSIVHILHKLDTIIKLSEPDHYYIVAKPVIPGEIRQTIYGSASKSKCEHMASYLTNVEIIKVR